MLNQFQQPVIQGHEQQAQTDQADHGSETLLQHHSTLTKQLPDLTRHRTTVLAWPDWGHGSGPSCATFGWPGRFLDEPAGVCPAGLALLVASGPVRRNGWSRAAVRHPDSKTVVAGVELPDKRPTAGSTSVVHRASGGRPRLRHRDGSRGRQRPEVMHCWHSSRSVACRQGDVSVSDLIGMGWQCSQSRNGVRRNDGGGSSAGCSRPCCGATASWTHVVRGLAGQCEARDALEIPGGRHIHETGLVHEFRPPGFGRGGVPKATFRCRCLL